MQVKWRLECKYPKKVPIEIAPLTMGYIGRKSPIRHKILSRKYRETDRIKTTEIEMDIWAARYSGMCDSRSYRLLDHGDDEGYS